MRRGQKREPAANKAVEFMGNQKKFPHFVIFLTDLELNYRFILFSRLGFVLKTFKFKPKRTQSSEFACREKQINENYKEV